MSSLATDLAVYADCRNLLLQYIFTHADDSIGVRKYQSMWAENGADRARKSDERERDLKKYGGAGAGGRVNGSGAVSGLNQPLVQVCSNLTIDWFCLTYIRILQQGRFQGGTGATVPQPRPPVRILPPWLPTKFMIKHINYTYLLYLIVTPQIYVIHHAQKSSKLTYNLMKTLQLLYPLPKSWIRRCDSIVLWPPAENMATPLPPNCKSQNRHCSAVNFRISNSNTFFSVDLCMSVEYFLFTWYITCCNLILLKNDCRR